MSDRCRPCLLNVTVLDLNRVVVTNKYWVATVCECMKTLFIEPPCN